MIARDPLKTRTTRYLIVFAILIGFAQSPARGSDRAAAAHVRDGVHLHQAGKFEQAAEAFSQAAATLPADPRIAFNQGCALAAQGKHDEAESRLRDAALARDPGLASAAYYNLGCSATEQMKALLGEVPAEAVGETRENALRFVRTAVDHYRNALRTNSEHTAARRNLELLRIWSKHIQDRWAERDRQRRREEMSLFEFLEWLQGEQRGVRNVARSLPGELASPTLRQAVRKLAATQGDLTLEIEPLKVKLDQALQPPGDPAATATPPPPATGALSPEVQRVRKALHGLADQAGQSMSRAVDALEHRNLADAIPAQTEVLLPLNQLFEILAPFEVILQAAIKSQSALVDTSTQKVAENAANSARRGETAQAVEDQEFVSGWSRMLIQKAEQRLAEVEAESSTAEQPTEIPLPERDDGAVPNASTSPDDGSTPVVPDRTSVEPAAAPGADPLSPTAESPAPPPDPRAALAKAIELGPRIVKLTRTAATDLGEQAWSEALPKQEEALKLLKEIAALLPPQEREDDQQEQDDQQAQDKQDDQKGNEKQEPDPEKQDGNQDSESEDEKKKQDQSDSEKNDDQNEPDTRDADQKKSRDEEHQDAKKLSRQQAESILRQVREREREHREFEKEIRRILRSRIIVEKDW